MSSCCNRSAIVFVQDTFHFVDWRYFCIFQFIRKEAKSRWICHDVCFSFWVLAFNIQQVWYICWNIKSKYWQSLQTQKSWRIPDLTEYRIPLDTATLHWMETLTPFNIPLNTYRFLISWWTLSIHTVLPVKIMMSV